MDEFKYHRSYPTMIEIMELLPYCIPNPWLSQMALLPRSMWDIPPNLQEILLKIYETDFPWDEPPFKGYRKIWLRDLSPTTKTDEENKNG